MKSLTLLVCLALTGCGTVFNGFASMMDAGDPCQSRGRANYQYPSYCGASGSGAVITRGYYNNRPVYSTRYERY